MENDKEVKIKITAGKSKSLQTVDSGIIYKKNPDIHIVLVDLPVKYCKIICTGSESNGTPDIMIRPPDISNTDDFSNTDNFINLEFSDYKDWIIMLANISRYTLYLALVKH